MAGANQIVKFAKVNREEQLDPLTTIGTQIHQRTPTVFAPPVFPGIAIPANVFTGDMDFTPATPLALTGPSATDLCSFFDTHPEMGLNPTAVGSRYEITVRSTNANPINITMGANVFPAVVTIPAMANLQYLAFELTQQAGPGNVPPQQWTLVQNIPSVGGGAVSSFGASAASQAAGNPANVRAGPALVGAPLDYMASDIGFVPTAGRIAATNTQAAIAELDTEKVTLRDIAGARSVAGATIITDILVASAAGDNYVPSGTVWGGRARFLHAVTLGAGGTTGTVGSIESNTDGTAALTAPLIVTHTAPSSAVAGYSLIRADSTGDGGFGTPAPSTLLQTNYLSLEAGGLNPGFGVFGAYHLVCSTGGNFVMNINSDGNVAFTDVSIAGVNAPLFQSAAGGYLTTNPSSQTKKKNIVDLSAADSAWVLKMRPRCFEYKDLSFTCPRFGFILEEVMAPDVGAHPCAFYYADVRNKKTNHQTGIGAPKSISFDAVTVALVAELKKAVAEINTLKTRVTALEAQI